MLPGVRFRSSGWRTVVRPTYAATSMSSNPMTDSSAGTPNAEGAGCSMVPSSLGVGRCEDRRRSLRQGEELGGDRTRDMRQPRSFAHVVDSAARFPPKVQGALVAAGPIAAPLEAKLRRRIADSARSSVAELDEGGGRHLADGDVIDRDAWESTGAPRRSGRTGRPAARRRSTSVSGGSVETTSRPSARSARSKQLERPALPGPPTRCRTPSGHTPDPLRPSTMPLTRLHGGRVREPGQKRRHHHRPPEGEAAGERARAVVQRLDRLDDPLAGARPHTHVAVEDARNGRDADAGQRGDVRDAGGATGRACRSGW